MIQMIKELPHFCGSFFDAVCFFPAVSKEALSADLLCIGEDHERVRIDFRDQLPQDDSLLLGDGDQKNRSVLAGIHACSGEPCGASVEFMHNAVGDFLVAGRNDKRRVSVAETACDAICNPA